MGFTKPASTLAGIQRNSNTNVVSVRPKNLYRRGEKTCLYKKVLKRNINQLIWGFKGLWGHLYQHPSSAVCPSPCIYNSLPKRRIPLEKNPPFPIQTAPSEWSGYITLALLSWPGMSFPLCDLWGWILSCVTVSEFLTMSWAASLTGYLTLVKPFDLSSPLWQGLKCQLQGLLKGTKWVNVYKTCINFKALNKCSMLLLTILQSSVQMLPPL